MSNSPFKASFLVALKKDRDGAILAAIDEALEEGKKIGYSIGCARGKLQEMARAQKENQNEKR